MAADVILRQDFLFEGLLDKIQIFHLKIMIVDTIYIYIPLDIMLWRDMDYPHFVENPKRF